MAYVIGRRVLKDTEEEFDSFAYGITLPLKKGDNGYFEQSFTSFEQAETNLKNLLLTAKGERIMQPEFGSGLHSILFEQMDDDRFETLVTQTIVDSVSYWLPYINIQNIEVEMTDELKDRNQANLYLQFTVGNQIDLQEITFTVQG
jgi:phage baseplate assembly protein W